MRESESFGFPTASNSQRSRDALPYCRDAFGSWAQGIIRSKPNKSSTINL